MRTPEGWAEEVTRRWEAHTYAGRVPQPFAGQYRDLLTDAVREIQAEAADEFRGVLWDACQEDPRRQVAAGAALARGQVLELLDGRKRRRLAEPTPHAGAEDAAVVAELDMLAACVAQSGPCVPLPPCELEARVRAVLAWAEGQAAEVDRSRAARPPGLSKAADQAEWMALVCFANHLRKALGE